MTDAREGLDPRYDARFQRGYDGHGADASAAASSPMAEPAAAGPAVTAPAGAEPSAAGPALAAVAQPMPAEPAVSPRHDAPVDAAAELRAMLAPDPEDEHDELDEYDERDERADDAFAGLEPDGAGHPRPERAEEARAGDLGQTTWGWLAGGWALCVVAVWLGAWLTWIVNADQSWYAAAPTPETPETQVWRSLGWAMAPSLLMGGTVGVVVVTAVAVVLQMRRPRRSAVTTRFARPATWWVLTAIVAAGLIAMPGFIGMLVEAAVMNMSGGIVYDGAGLIDEGQQAKIDVMVRGQYAQAIVGPLSLGVIAGVVAITLVEARRSVFAARGRSVSARAD